MGSKSIFEEPFDDGTKVKLDIFERYLKEWLPVFVSRSSPIWRKVQIFDFFSGEGKDKQGTLGSPLIILKVVNSLLPYIRSNNIELRIVFNDLKCFDTLKQNVEEYGIESGYRVEIYNEDFKILFQKNYASMKGAANFLFFDQNGIKEITQDIFEQVVQLKQTDFLFFISSSFFKRFAATKEFKNYFPFSPEELQTLDYYHIHRRVLQHYKSLISLQKTYYLAPFSIKKATNIYGLIFGTNHTFGLEKFLSVAWRIDKQRGEANYDIDGENIVSERPSLFNEFNIPTKRQVFEKAIRTKILEGVLVTQLDAYHFALEEGFQLKDVNKIFKTLQAEGKIIAVKMISEGLHKETHGIPLLKQM